MARSALPAARALCELPVMWIRLVAVGAMRERNRLFEIAARMTARTIHRRVLAQQWILCLRMIEVPVHRRQRNLLPALGVVTRLAALRKAAVMRIGVAVRTLSKRKPAIARLIVRPRCMALLAFHLRVHSGERILRFAMVEFADGDIFPIGRVVTLRAIAAQSAFMRVLVASSAGLRHAQKTARQILHLDCRTRRDCNVLGSVAAGTGKPSMFSHESIARELVIERLRIPLDQRKVLAVMFRVAF